ncbi:PREDICTED: progesterone-induced-blocking factor 1-like [Priapulus caudatus]|uniref:Progesterone-induced-blocking factor 1-like n=1 Tax=Priapulus caudatus TaxID=37621 RepID=A0ABM1EQD3_PRICU|nr:PREDICTED: progesterone-induced-blocking factor 1-like [Priapulus caudatus]
MEKRQALLDATLQTTRAERDDLLKEVAAAKQSVALLKQDKDYLTRQTTELTDRGRRGDERLQQALTQLEGAKVAREEAYEKLADARYAEGARRSRGGRQDRGIARRVCFMLRLILRPNIVSYNGP